MKNLTFYGIDADNETSLMEYGLLVSNEEHEDGSGTHFVIYSMGEYGAMFGTGHISEEEVNGFVLGKEFPDAKNIKSFLSTCDMTKKQWLKQDLASKLFDLIQYYGRENIMGCDYYPVTLETLKANHNLGF